MNHPNALVLVMQPPLGTIQALAETAGASMAASILSEAELLELVAAQVASGQDVVVVDLRDVPTATVDEVKTLTGFLWDLRVEGARPVVVVAGRDIANACRSLKLDQAFPLAGCRADALAALEES